MAAPVRVEAAALSDPRIELLGQLAGYNRYEALGRLTHLWSVCTEKGLHVATEALVRACIGPGGVQHMLDAELAERVEGGLRIRGTDGRIEWLGDLSSKRQHAGRERAAKGARDARGRLLPAHAGDAGPAPSSTVQQTTSTEPAQSSALTLTPTLTPEEVCPDARARPATGFADKRSAVTHTGWRLAAAEHARLRAGGVEPNARVFPGLPVGQGAGELVARVQELTAGDAPDYEHAARQIAHVVAVRVAEAERTRSLRWFAASTMWGSVPFWRALDMTVDDARSGPPPKETSAPKRAANVGRVEPAKPSEYQDGEVAL